MRIEIDRNHEGIAINEIGINESNVLVRALVTTANEFLLRYLQHDGPLSERRIMLVKAAVDVVFSASYVSSECKHELLHDVHEKLKAVTSEKTIGA